MQSPRNSYRARPSLSPRRLPPAPSANHDFRMGASPQAVEWWDTHVYRTHLRSPISSPRATPHETSALGLSPRAIKARGMHMAGLNARAATAGSMDGVLGATGSFPPFMKGAVPPPRPGEKRLPTPLAPIGGVFPASHPIHSELTALFMALKMIDHDGDGFLSPTDIARGLATFGLSSSDTQATNKVNDMVMKHMKNNGMILYSGFVMALANDPYISSAIKKVKAEAAANELADRRAAAAVHAAPKGPQLRPGVTADEMRHAQAIIKDKLMDKFSGFQQAFRSVDKDGSGYINRGELEACLLTLNLNMLRKDVVDTLIDFIDCENNLDDDTDGGPTDIHYREFARAMATDDIMKMAPLQAKVHVNTPPPTPPPIDRAASTVASIVKVKFKPENIRKAFEFVDTDKSGSLSRAEVKRTLSMWGAPLTESELDELFTKCDKDGDGQINYQEFIDIVQKSPALTEPRELVKQPQLRPGVRAEDMRKAQQMVKEKILTKFSKFQEAFKFIDKDRSGTITREELMLNIDELQLGTMIKQEVKENLVDFIDVDDGGTKIEYKEYARVFSADDVMSMAPLKAVAPRQAHQGFGRHKMDDMPGAQGIEWSTVGA